MAAPSRNNAQAIPLIYRLFFLYIEPLASLVGAYYAFLQPQEYLRLTDPSSSPIVSTPLSTSIILQQLSNLYFLFALNEALVLRATFDIHVWRTLLFGLLVADVGHLYSVNGLGSAIYWDVFQWNAIDWGNVAFVYAGASMRICFLAGLGMSNQGIQRVSKRRANKK
ncbi:MAG: hypothetical protein L6R38_002902 [Xanthoria sp. 2 TBL-2021]|nr:MAG: hypothetical protein L6R38_002902 [Xanthoria sp. 2 TBL-2021]